LSAAAASASLEGTRLVFGGSGGAVALCSSPIASADASAQHSLSSCTSALSGGCAQPCSASTHAVSEGSSGAYSAARSVSWL